MVLRSFLFGLLGACFLHAAGKEASGCTLASLTLRYGDWPIDLDTPFEPDITEYTATLDFSMSSFSINVRPDTGCEVDNVPNEPIPVHIGDTKEVVLYARHPATGAHQEYTVTVSRLLGSETELRLLEVDGGVMRPVFNPKIRDYHVRLDLGYDKIRVVYRLYDNEQRIRSAAQQQHPTGEDLQTTETISSPMRSLNTTNTSGSPLAAGLQDDAASQTEGGRQLQAQNPRMSHQSHGTSQRSSCNQWRVASSQQQLQALASRRLGQEVRSGESQLRQDAANFMLDVGFSRTLELIVQCADATQASIGRYKLEVSRQGCGPTRPYFDPQKKFCVYFCSAGFYRNRETRRCSHCNTNCKQCTGLLQCKMCLPDTIDFSYAIQPDGKCKAIPNHLFKRYRWWCIGLGLLLTLLVLIGCIGLCQLCCRIGRGRGRHQKLRTYDTDSEDDDAPVYTHGKLALY